MQRAHVDVGGIGLVQGGGDIAFAQNGTERVCLVYFQGSGGGRHIRKRCKRPQHLELALRCDVKTTPWPRERSLCESRGRIEQEIAARAPPRGEQSACLALRQHRSE